MSKSSVINHKEKRINAISKKANVMMLCILSVFALLCVLPVLLVVVVSFSSEQSIFQNGYSFFPTQLSLNAYRFFLRLGDQIIRSYGITIFVTIVGTLFSLAVTTMLSYVLSRPDYRYGKILTFLLLFTMLFNGGAGSQLYGEHSAAGTPGFGVGADFSHVAECLLCDCAAYIF